MQGRGHYPRPCSGDMVGFGSVMCNQARGTLAVVKLGVRMCNCPPPIELVHTWRRALRHDGRTRVSMPHIAGVERQAGTAIGKLKNGAVG